MRRDSRIFWWALVLLWCGTIFYFSSKPVETSQRESLFIVAIVNRLASAVAGTPFVLISDHQVRKGAHLFEYLVLGSLLTAGFQSRQRRVRKTALWVICAGALYAGSDEVHQRFVPGRSSRIGDVVIDETGVAGGMLAALWIARRRRVTCSTTAR